ncbi:MazG nucleotide pyrophosphohydrolase domain-containing protein [Nocardioides sp.]|uniref:MazG nucleotide pyrophosphohydrolase domain-containing protein n=1 Tax=Nocardioides sp. TaxID=35761 RepID=UPI003784BCF6
MSAAFSPHRLLREYLAARGLAMPAGASARKVVEEAHELAAECRRDTPEPAKIMHELADVVFAAMVVAEHHGFTVEEAMRSKIELDTGRERSHPGSGCST